MLISGSTLSSLKKLGGRIKARSIPQFFGEVRRLDKQIVSADDDGMVRSFVDVADLGDADAYVVLAHRRGSDDSYTGTVAWYTDEGLFSVAVTRLPLPITADRLAGFARSVADDLSAS